jgi:hypothetical protein
MLECVVEQARVLQHNKKLAEFQVRMFWINFLLSAGLFNEVFSVP